MPHRALVFQLVVGAGLALHAALFQLAVRAGCAHHAIVLLLSVRASLTSYPHYSPPRALASALRETRGNT